MKKVIAAMCSGIMLLTVAFSFTVNASYNEDTLKNAVESAAAWNNTKAKPENNIGSEYADLAIIAMGRAGISYDYASYLKGLDGIAEGYGSTTNVHSLCRTILAVLACGGDAEYIGGKDLVADATYYRSDDAPLGDGGTIDYIDALLILDSGDFNLPDDWNKNNRDSLIAALLSRQDEEGSFGDVYTTAAAVIAMSPYNNSVEYVYTKNGEAQTNSCGNAIYNAISYLSKEQSKAGDFYALSDTAMVSMAMDAAGIDEYDSRMTKNGRGVMDGILDYQNSDGGFSEDLNNSDATATGYAMCALVSRLREKGGKAEFFDFTSSDSLGISAAASGSTASTGGSNGTSNKSNSSSSSSNKSNSSSSSSNNSKSANSSSSASNKSSSSSRSSSSAKATATPGAAKRSSAVPRATVKPSSTAKATSSPEATATPNPTEKPDLVGPVRQVGPPKPDDGIDTADLESMNENAGRSKAAPIAVTVIGILAAAAAAGIYMMKKKIGIFKEKKKAVPKYEIHHHRKTESHRKYEQRRRFEQHRKYEKRR